MPILIRRKCSGSCDTYFLFLLFCRSGEWASEWLNFLTWLLQAAQRTEIKKKEKIIARHDSFLFHIAIYTDTHRQAGVWLCAQAGNLLAIARWFQICKKEKKTQKPERRARAHRNKLSENVANNKRIVKNLCASQSYTDTRQEQYWTLVLRVQRRKKNMNHKHIQHSSVVHFENELKKMPMNEKNADRIIKEMPVSEHFYELNSLVAAAFFFLFIKRWLFLSFNRH